jgi:hypothetical protein
MLVVLGRGRCRAKRDAVDGCAAMRERGHGGAGHDMAAKSFVILAALGLLGLANVAPADAQPQYARATEVSAQKLRHSARPRIQVNRGRLLYRQCTGGYELQYRPSGTVLFPYRHCWWVRG